MKKVLSAAAVAAVLALGPLGTSGAESARFKHLVSLYLDDQGASIHLPEGVACDARGQVLIGDTGNDRLLRFTFRDGKVTGGSQVRIPQLAAPARVHLGSKGDIYALDGKQRRIVRLSAEGEFKGAVAFDGVPPPATVVPKGFDLDASDHLYVLDLFAARVLVLDAEGTFLKALPLPAGTRFASDVAVDDVGTVLVLDAVGRRIYAATKEATAFAPLGGDRELPLVTLPVSLTSSRGTVFVVEGRGSAIAAFGQDGTFLARQLTSGWQEGTLNHPSQICINDKDEVFVADRDNSRVQVFALSR